MPTTADIDVTVSSKPHVLAAGIGQVKTHITLTGDGAYASGVTIKPGTMTGTIDGEQVQLTEALYSHFEITVDDPDFDGELIYSFGVTSEGTPVIVFAVAPINQPMTAVYRVDHPSIVPLVD